MTASLGLALIISLALCMGLLLPYVIEEIRRGKIDLGPRFPAGAGDITPGYRGNPAPGRPLTTPSGHATLSLRSFHLVLITLSMVLAAGTGAWGLRHRQVLLGALSLGIAVLLLLYGGYFVAKADNEHLE